MLDFITATVLPKDYTAQHGEQYSHLEMYLCSATQHKITEGINIHICKINYVSKQKQIIER